MNAIKALLTGGQIVAYYPQLARALEGNINAAILVGQLAHWDKYSSDGWVFRTQDQLEEETALSPKAQLRARTHLKKLFVIQEKRSGVPARLYFKIDYQKIQVLLQSSHIVQSRVATSSNHNKREYEIEEENYLTNSVLGDTEGKKNKPVVESFKHSRVKDKRKHADLIAVVDESEALRGVDRVEDVGAPLHTFGGE